MQSLQRGPDINIAALQSHMRLEYRCAETKREPSDQRREEFSLARSRAKPESYLLSDRFHQG